MLQSLYQSKTRHATWLELFFDLVFVAVIGVVTHDLAHTHHGHIAKEQFLKFPMIFIPVWWIWASHTLYSNRFDNDDHHHRLITLLIMGITVALSTFSKDFLTTGFMGFILSYSVIRLLTAYLYHKIKTDKSEHKKFASQILRVILISSAIGLSSLFTNGIWPYIIFHGSILFDMIAQDIVRGRFKNFPIDKKHFIERIGLLAIIILGESVISIVGTLTNIEWNMMDIISAVCGFTIIGGIWWIYYDSFSKLEEAKRIKNANILLFGHVLLCMGLILLANVIRHAMLNDINHHTFGYMGITGLILFYIGKQAQYVYAFPPFRKNIYINSSVCVLITIGSVFLQKIEYALIGMTCAILFYVWANFKWTLRQNVKEYLD